MGWRSCLSLIMIMMLCCVFTCAVLGDDSSDKDVLVEFKKAVLDPSGLLSTWTESSHHCSWHGVICDKNSKVLSLNITGFGSGHGGEIPIALSLCKKLRYLDLSSNKRLTGELFQELPVPCLSVFDVSDNLLSGSIPEFYVDDGCPDVLTSDSYALEPFNPTSAYLSYFATKTQAGKPFGYFGGDGGPAVFHNFGGNNFTGNVLSMPLAPQRFEDQISYAFFAGGNLLSGPFPGSFFEDCNGLSALFINVSYNRMSGQLPAAEISLCKSLHFLDVAANQITGPIPPGVGDLASLVALDLSRNLLEDQIPISLGQMRDLTFLSLAGNNLTGSLPSSFQQLQALEILDMSLNSLAGEIPDGLLMSLTNLIVLRLNNNKLSGQIPSGLANASLIYFNVSFNNLSGPLPSRMKLMDCSSLVGNPFLDPCLASPDQAIAAQMRNYTGHTAREKIFNTTEVAVIVSVPAIITLVPALLSFFVYGRKWISKLKRLGHGEEEITIFTDIGVRLTYEGILRATQDFSASNCIGNGGFGSTYKAEMSPGFFVAVKKLGFGRMQGFEQFEAEINTLGKLRHPNLVTLIGYCAGDEMETFLVYNYLEGGNLDKFIREGSARGVDWKILHKIALDVACALAYLHNQCVPRILHRDVKPSNVLLDDEYNAYLSDFGLARFMEETSRSRSHMTIEVAGTYGYVAPEYATLGHASEKADVYSYGVLLLELFSDKKAEDPSFADYGYDFNIVQWCCLLRQQGKVKDFFAAGLWDSNHQNELEEIFQLGLVCTLSDHSIRPKMEQVERRLKQLQPR
ncbi:hypothetical protein CCACVL1_22986 [Corchorus capsularis]|uniref:non-specific serine/threonine protein kinase n=1 Tax=Corchorus capsularis TaxID=210143 RepID=A0A1R3GVN7_COCAP|nr:hypothetical protein CCACVL1_22986 [Corchorus capsularis]